MARREAGDARPGPPGPRRDRGRGDRGRATGGSRSSARAPSCRRVPTPRSSCDLAGRWITPGLIDCHTHLVYAGDRAHEFELRLEGATYEEIAGAGGGIVSTVRRPAPRTRTALTAATLPRLDALIAEGVTTVEIKSGYGLDLATELRHAAGGAARSPEQRPVGVATTFLGAHALPPEAEGDQDAYIDRVCARDAAAPSPPRAWPTRSTPSARASPSRRSRLARVFEAARELGLPVQAARRPALGPRRRRARGRASAPSRPTTSSTRARPAPRRWRRPARSRCCCPAPSTSCARPRPPPVEAFRASRRADGRGDRLQPRHLAAHLAACWR